MKHIIAIFIYIILINITGNFFLYFFNLTNILLIRDLFKNGFIDNFLILIFYSTILMIISYLIFNKIFIKLDRLLYYPIFSLILFILTIFMFKYIFKIERINEINNILCILLQIFLSTYVFYYSFYNLTLIKYKRNH